MLIELAATKEMVTHHASCKQKNHDGQDHYEQNLCKTKPRWILFFRVHIVPIRGHELLSRQASQFGGYAV